MPDGTSLAEVKISELPVGTAANPTDQLEANQAGVSRSITVGQVATYVSGTLPTPPTSLPPSGAASGDLAGSYPAPTIKTSVGLTGTPTAPTPTPGTDNSTRIATTAFVQSAVAGVSVTIPAGTIAFGGAGGVVTGNSTLAWDNTGKAFAITGYTGATAAFSAAGSVPASPAVDAFLMSIANPSGNTGNIFRLRAGAAGTTDQFKVDMTGDAAASGSIQAFALSAPPAGGNGAFGIFLGNFTGGNSGLYFGTGAPTLSTFGRYGSLYINTATPGIPYYNNNGTTGWDQLVGLTATQTLTNKSATTPSPGDNTTKIATTAYVQAALAAGASISVGDTPPGSPGTNALWWNSVLGTLMLWYTDPNTSQWVPASPAGTNKLLQEVSVETGAVATGTTIIPLDDTIPQITEGDQYMTLAITPQSATSRLVIDVLWNGMTSAGTPTCALALFQDSTANALAATWAPASANVAINMKLTHSMTSGSTSATTFRVRVGLNVSGTLTFNGNGTRFFGGVMASSIVIREVTP